MTGYKTQEDTLKEWSDILKKDDVSKLCPVLCQDDNFMQFSKNSQRQENPFKQPVPWRRIGDTLPCNTDNPMFNKEFQNIVKDVQGCNCQCRVIPAPANHPAIGSYPSNTTPRGLLMGTDDDMSVCTCPKVPLPLIMPDSIRTNITKKITSRAEGEDKSCTCQTVPPVGKTLGKRKTPKKKRRGNKQYHIKIFINKGMESKKDKCENAADDERDARELTPQQKLNTEGICPCCKRMLKSDTTDGDVMSSRNEAPSSLPSTPYTARSATPAITSQESDFTNGDNKMNQKPKLNYETLDEKANKKRKELSEKNIKKDRKNERIDKDDVKSVIDKSFELEQGEIMGENELNFKDGEEQSDKKKDKCKSMIKSPYIEGMYPGLHAGHATCCLPHMYVPRNMGWLWNLCEGAGKTKPGLDWKPGAINVTVARLMAIAKKKPATYLYEPSVKEAAVTKKEKNLVEREEVPSQGEYPGKPSLHVHKTKGQYYVSMHPQDDKNTDKKHLDRRSDESVIIAFNPESSDSTGTSRTAASTVSDDSMEMDYTSAQTMHQRKLMAKRYDVKTETK